MSVLLGGHGIELLLNTFAFTQISDALSHY